MGGLTQVFGVGVDGLSVEAAARESKKLFVRSEGQLAVFEEWRNPTGHVLTAWEAFTAYGFDVLAEAVEHGSAILRRTTNSTGNALQRRREALGLSCRAVGRATELSESDVWTAESAPSRLALSKLERVAFSLGLDERLLAFSKDSGGDDRLAYRLRTLLGERARRRTISERTALLFSEAASIIRVQLRLQKWLGLQMERDAFEPHGDYGSPRQPAWRIGYNLAEDARNTLRLGQNPIPSMRELVERRMGIPVIQTELPARIAGATVMTVDEEGREARGIVLNTVGDNTNIWIRRATLAHELGHLLYDPDESLENVRVDSYIDSQKDPETGPLTDFVEQRANAFAIAFLAPNDAVSKLAPTPVSAEAVSNVMHTFGISHTAARYHIANSHHRQFEIPSRAVSPAPSDEQKAAENFTVDYFPLPNTPIQRRGRFSGLVAESYVRGVISEDTAALYLRCSTGDLLQNVEHLRDLYEIS